MLDCNNLERVEERITKACERSGRKREEVVLLGATKTVKPEIIRHFYRCGLKVFGENRVQEFLKKHEELKDLNIEWHFIGRLQSNKVKYIIDKVELIHSLDRESLLDEIEKRAGKINKIQRVLLEVNVGAEETKGGVLPEEVFSFTEKVLSRKNISLEGLMTIPPYEEDPERSRKYFVLLRELKEKLEEEFSLKLPHLSMGMSDDFEIAIEEGATIVRIGTLLFGERG